MAGVNLHVMKSEKQTKSLSLTWFHSLITCVADVSFSFGEIEQASEQAGERTNAPGLSENREKWGGGEREGVWGGEKRIVPSVCFFWKRLLRRLTAL